MACRTKLTTSYKVAFLLFKLKLQTASWQICSLALRAQCMLLIINLLMFKTINQYLIYLPFITLHTLSIFILYSLFSFPFHIFVIYNHIFHCFKVFRSFLYRNVHRRWYSTSWLYLIIILRFYRLWLFLISSCYNWIFGNYKWRYPPFRLWGRILLRSLGTWMVSWIEAAVWHMKLLSHLVERKNFIQLLKSWLRSGDLIAKVWSLKPRTWSYKIWWNCSPSSSIGISSIFIDHKRLRSMLDHWCFIDLILLWLLCLHRRIRYW